MFSMTRMITFRWLVWLFLISFAGCASMSKHKDVLDRLSQLEDQMSELQEQQNQFQKIVVSQAELEKDIGEILAKYEPKEGLEVDIDTPSNEQIQTALKNAGFYEGDIDGKIGAKTRDAIMAFQKQNELKIDGIVGKNTWEILKQYLNSNE